MSLNTRETVSCEDVLSSLCGINAGSGVALWLLLPIVSELRVFIGVLVHNGTFIYERRKMI